MAMSWAGSRPTTTPPCTRLPPSTRRIVEPPSITWLFVTTSPWVSKTQPVPNSSPPEVCTSTVTTRLIARSATVPSGWETSDDVGVANGPGMKRATTCGARLAER